MEHPHKDSAWFTKSENNQCKASPQHSVTLLLDNFPQGAVAGIAALLRCGYIYIYKYRNKMIEKCYNILSNIYIFLETDYNI